VALTTRLRSEQLPAALGVNIAPGATGTISASAGLFERGRAVALAEWIAVAYAAGNFTSSTGTWTVGSGDQIVFRYALIGKTILIDFTFDTTTVSGGQSQLRFAIPGGFVSAQDMFCSGFFNDNGVGWLNTLNIFVTAGGTFVGMQPPPLGVGTWSAATNNTYVRGFLIFEVQ
jgi:hypothetical protein